MLIDDYGLDSDFLKSSLDEEESSRVEQEENQTLIIVDTAVSEVQKDDTLIFYTMPLGIILTDHYVFTISLRENKVINDVVSGRVRNIQTQFRTQFVLRLMMNIFSGIPETNRQNFQCHAAETAWCHEESRTDSDAGTGKIPDLLLHITEIQ